MSSDPKPIPINIPAEPSDPARTPRPQPHFHHDGSSWIPSSASPPASGLPAASTQAFRLLSWNIDMFTHFSEARMDAGLSYLSSLTSSFSPSDPVIIFLQEMTQPDMRQIRDAEWVQRRFYLTDLDREKWLGDFYGTTALVDRRLQIQSVFRVPWYSRFERDGLFIDVVLSKDGAEKQVLRLCNTHLESLVANPPVRPVQLSDAAKVLGEHGVAAAVLAGDLNAIQPFDRTLHIDNGLQDAYLELGGKEDIDEGFTWGQQAPQELREKFGCSRMDKILFRGATKVRRFERIGAGIRVDERVWKDAGKTGDPEWVTDHYGIMGQFEIGEGWKMGTQGEMGSLKPVPVL